MLLFDMLGFESVTQPISLNSIVLTHETAMDNSREYSSSSVFSKKQHTSAYNEKEMLKVMFSIVSENLSFKAAITKHRLPIKFPKSTVSEKLSVFSMAVFGKKSYLDVPLNERQATVTLDMLEPFTYKTRPGPKTYLNVEQELALAAVLYYFSLDGLSISLRLVRKILKGLAVNWKLKFRKEEVSKGFLAAFLSRHPEVKVREGRILDEIRKAGETQVPPFMSSISKRIENVDARLIANLDETMCSYQSKHIMVVGASSAKVASMCGTETENPHISLLPVVLAS